MHTLQADHRYPDVYRELDENGEPTGTVLDLTAPEPVYTRTAPTRDETLAFCKALIGAGGSIAHACAETCTTRDELLEWIERGWQSSNGQCAYFVKRLMRFGLPRQSGVRDATSPADLLQRYLAWRAASGDYGTNTPRPSLRALGVAVGVRARAATHPTWQGDADAVRSGDSSIVQRAADTGRTVDEVLAAAARYVDTALSIERTLRRAFGYPDPQHGEASTYPPTTR